jgi:hypothetical protein
MSRGINRLSLDCIDQIKVAQDKTAVDLSVYVDGNITFVLSTGRKNELLLEDTLLWCDKLNENVQNTTEEYVTLFMCWICPWVQTWSCNSESNIG